MIDRSQSKQRFGPISDRSDGPASSLAPDLLCEFWLFSAQLSVGGLDIDLRNAGSGALQDDFRLGQSPDTKTQDLKLQAAEQC